MLPAIVNSPASPERTRSAFLAGVERLTLLRSAAHILVIDDEEPNLALVRRILEKAGYRSVTSLNDPRRLEEILGTVTPDLVITDWHMPHRDGFQVLEALQPLIVEEHLPVLMVTGDGSSEAKNRALGLGARDFLTKPFDRTEMTLRVRNQLETRLLYQEVRKQNRTLLEAVHGRTRQLEEARVEMLQRLAMAAEYRDDATNRHNERVGEIAGHLAEAMGFSADDVQRMRRAAPLHDIGKIGIPDALLLKAGALTPEEVSIMRTHTTIGTSILAGSDAPVLQLAEVIALTHHEWWDGSGYPRGLAGAAIPVPGRIVAVADAFDAQVSDRPYRRARSVPEAYDEIVRFRGSQFDPAVVDALAFVLPKLQARERDAATS